MIKTEREVQSDELAGLVIKGMQEKKGEKIVQLRLKEVDGAVTDYFVVCEAKSTTQIEAIKRSVEEEVRKACGEKPWHIEGTQNSEWVLIDYVNVVVHIFQPEVREFFDIEGLWADAEIKEIEVDY